MSRDPDRNPWGTCPCGQPATLDHHDQPLGACNDCREDDKWFRCSDCGETLLRQGIGCSGYVVTIEHGDRVWRCHTCSREVFEARRKRQLVGV